MKERPILFSGVMVRAILHNRKSQTRRVAQLADNVRVLDGIAKGYLPGLPDGFIIPCPYGQPGNRLWVRETFNRCGCHACQAAWPGQAESKHGVTYREGYGGPSGLSFRPSIFMPRWASRISLEITAVRIERVQQISFDDCLAEGIIETDQWGNCKAETVPDDLAQPGGEIDMDRGWMAYTREAYRDLWNAINDKRGMGWGVNPWVWVVSFRRIESERNATAA